MNINGPKEISIIIPKGQNLFERAFFIFIVEKLQKFDSDRLAVKRRMKFSVRTSDLNTAN